MNEKYMKIYNQLKAVPEEAKKTITGGRLNGMTEIKPMWRIQKLTETFGMAGFGWKTEVTNKEIIDGANGEKIAIVDINLYVKMDTEWSEPIHGTGGSSFISKEKSGLYTSDECFKMAYTDAISVACKALGIGADVYMNTNDSKYIAPKEEPTKEDAEAYIVQFKKHQGEKLSDVIEKDPSYITWLVNKSDDEYLKKCIELLTGETSAPKEEPSERLKLIVEFEKLVNQTGTEKEKIYEYYQVENNTQMTEGQLSEAIGMLKTKLGA